MSTALKEYDPNAYCRRAKFKEKPLSSAQEKLWEQTRTAFIWHAPAFSHILYTMLSRSGSQALFTDEVPIAATDGLQLVLNPDPFFKLDLQERVFVMAHEVLHCIYDHCGLGHAHKMRGYIRYSDGKTLQFSPELMNIATDLVINDILVESRVGKMPPVGLHDKSIATGEDSVVDVYRKIFKKFSGGGGGKKPNDGKGGFDILLDPGEAGGEDPDKAKGDRSEQEWKTAVAGAVAAAKAQGKLPAGLERLLGEVVDPKVDWRDRLRSLVARKTGSDVYDFRKLDRRLIVRNIGAPGKSGFGCGDIVVACDTSGSIGQAELDAFFAEMASILEDARPRRLFVMWCDAEVHRVDELEEGGDLNSVRAKGAPGGGGTSFAPVWKKIKSLGLRPDVCVYLTDGYGEFGKAPPYEVIWGSITPEGAVKYPFGDVVYIDMNS